MSRHCGLHAVVFSEPISTTPDQAHAFGRHARRPKRKRKDGKSNYGAVERDPNDGKRTAELGENFRLREVDDDWCAPVVGAFGDLRAVEEDGRVCDDGITGVDERPDLGGGGYVGVDGVIREGCRGEEDKFDGPCDVEIARGRDAD